MNLQKSILQTIAFFDLFDYPLTAEEIKANLINYRKPVHIKEIKGLLAQMESVIEPIHNYYVVKGREEIIDRRKARKFISEKYWARTHQYTKYLKKTPFIKMFAVCNNLAFDNAKETSDIDLYIVVKKGRMWTARILTTAIMQFFGVRRHGNKIAGRFCLSFFVTEEKLSMKEHAKKVDPYLGYWTKLIKPVYGRQVFERFKKENETWLNQEFGLNFSEENEKQLAFERKSKQKLFFEWCLNGRIGNVIESALKKVFKKRAKQKAKALGPKASILISDQTLKFHNLDRRTEYAEKWQEQVDYLEKRLLTNHYRVTIKELQSSLNELTEERVRTVRS